MTDPFPSLTASPTGNGAVAGNGPEAFPARPAEIGDLTVRRILPVRQCRMVGPWCFFDRFGPMSFTSGKPMDVAPHPHIGLQTVSWLLAGEVLHNDSIGGIGLLRPGELNLMTAGAGIAHAEETPPAQSGKLDGVQLWIALPAAHRHSAPSFAHHTDIPLVEFAGGRGAVIMGELAGSRSPGQAFSPLVGSELVIDKGGRLELPLNPSFEHALAILDGSVAGEGQPLAPDMLYYLRPGRDQFALSSREGARILLLGGLPFGEPIVLWWNFVAATAQEIHEAREDWEQHRRFGDVKAYRGARLAAPPMPAHIRSSQPMPT